jgi:hypothetical protein
VGQRLALLQGLMDTDGSAHVQKRGGAVVCEFSVVREYLARGVHELLLGLGVKVTWRENLATLNGRQVGTRYRLVFQTDLPVFRLPRKAERLAPLRTRRAKLRYVVAVDPVPSVPVRCIQVDREDGLFLAGRECVPTHNSELLIQLAVCAAFGLHPFTGEAGGRPVRVLHVDTENERDDMRPRYRRVVDIAERYAKTDLDRDGLMFEDRTDGLELALPASDDLAWLDRLMLSARPDLLVIGPVYKLTGEDIDKATVAKALTANLDRLRVRHQITLLIEAHPGNAQDQVTGHRIMRPQGSALFRRWPNVGLGLRAHWTVAETDTRPWLAEVVRWRGNRTARDWPRAVRVGRAGGMPWIGVPDMELHAIEEDARAKRPRRTNTRKAAG